MELFALPVADYVELVTPSSGLAHVVTLLNVEVGAACCSRELNVRCIQSGARHRCPDCETVQFNGVH